MNTYDQIDDASASRPVFRGAVAACTWIVAATLLILWAGSLWRPLGLALLWLEVAVAVLAGLKMTGIASVSVVLVALGYQGDRYDLPEPSSSRRLVVARIVEMSCLVASLYILFHSFNA